MLYGKMTVAQVLAKYGVRVSTIADSSAHLYTGIGNAPGRAFMSVLKRTVYACVDTDPELILHEGCHLILQRCGHEMEENEFKCGVFQLEWKLSAFLLPDLRRGVMEALEDYGVAGNKSVGSFYDFTKTWTFRRGRARLKELRMVDKRGHITWNWPDFTKLKNWP